MSNLARAGLEWLVISVTLACALRWWWTAPLAVLVLGSRQHALLVLGHEGTHGWLYPKRKINDWLVNLLLFWPVMVDLKAYRDFHFEHHKHLGTELDPELKLKGQFADRWFHDMTPQKLRRLVIRDLLGLNWHEVMVAGKAFQGRYTPVRMAYVGLFLVLLSALWPAILLWFSALLTSQFACQRLRMWREHVGTTGTLQIPSSWYERLIYLPHGIGAHWEHHERW